MRDLNSSHDQMSYAVFCLRSEEHTSELQSRSDLVCRLLLEKKKRQHVRPREKRASTRRNPSMRGAGVPPDGRRQRCYSPCVPSPTRRVTLPLIHGLCVNLEPSLRDASAQPRHVGRLGHSTVLFCLLKHYHLEHRPVGHRRIVFFFF